MKTVRSSEPDLPADGRTGTLAAQLSEAARELQRAQDDPEATLREVVKSAIVLIPGAEEASITEVAGRKSLESRAASSELPERVDAVMLEVGEGPCLDALFEERIVRVPEMATEQRWPRFAPAAVQLGAHSMLSFQLRVEGDNLGSLNLYASKPRAFTDESEHIGAVFATHAAIGYASAKQLDQLNDALQTRDLIGQAVGILMERYSITSDRAFATLIRISQQSNRKLRDLAAELVGATEFAVRRDT